jgi:hypothetical protein
MTHWAQALFLLALLYALTGCESASNQLCIGALNCTFNAAVPEDVEEQPVIEEPLQLMKKTALHLRRAAK